MEWKVDRLLEGFVRLSLPSSSAYWRRVWSPGGTGPPLDRHGPGDRYSQTDDPASGTLFLMMAREI